MPRKLRITVDDWALICDGLSVLHTEASNKACLDYAEQFGLDKAREQEMLAKRIEHLLSRIRRGKTEPGVVPGGKE